MKFVGEYLYLKHKQGRGYIDTIHNICYERRIWREYLSYKLILYWKTGYLITVFGIGRN